MVLVRAEVREDLREDFGQWYESKHLPQVCEALDDRSARRSGSAIEPGVPLRVLRVRLA